MNYFLTIIPILILSGIILIGVKKTNQTHEFFSYEYTNAIKAIACIIVIYVHVPSMYSNRLQDMVGSFAYVGVFSFFLISAYGCRYKVDKAQEYLTGFLKKRLIALLVPALVINTISFTLSYLYMNELAWKKLYMIDRYVYAIIVAYIVFYLVWKCNKIAYQYKDLYVCCGCLLLSLITYFSSIKPFFIWPTESIGFVFGVLLYRYKNKLLSILQGRQLTYELCFLGTSLLLGIVYLKTKHVFFWGGLLIRVFLALSLLILAFAFTIKVEFSGRGLAILGKCSYAVYLVHPVVIAFICQRVTDMTSGGFVLTVVMCTVGISIVVTFLSNKLINCLLMLGGKNG